MVGGGSFEALKLENCEVSSNGGSGPEDDFIVYGLDPIRSKISASELRFNDIATRLRELGLCSGCTDNVAMLYIEKPKSRCAIVAQSALEGNPDALRELQQNPDYCTYR